MANRRAIVVAAAFALLVVPFLVALSMRSTGQPPAGSALGRPLADSSLADSIARSRGRPSLLARLITENATATASWQAD